VNILVFCHEYPPQGGGGGVGAKQYAEAWASKGHRVTLVTSQVNHLPAQEVVNGVEIVRIYAPGIRARATIPLVAMAVYCALGFVFVLSQARRLRVYDVINSHFCIPGGLLGVAAAKVLGLPHVLTIIGGDIFDPTKSGSPHRHRLTRAINRLVLRLADRIVAISSDTKRRAHQYYEAGRDIRIIPYGFVPVALPQSAATLRDQSGPFRVIAVGRLVKRKGFEYLIRALALLPQEVQLTIVGDGPLHGELLTLAQALGVAGRVTLAGYKTREEIFAHLAASDCYGLSSLHEGLCIAVQEAMYAGLPIVATNNGGQVDLIRDPHNGLLVDPASADQLAAALGKFYADRDFARRVARTNREDIERHLIGANSEEYLALFGELAAARAAHPSRRELGPTH
jgi:glycosyltransferase involved in cell wall biosynthesis